MAMRKEWEVSNAQFEMCDKVWFGRATKYVLNEKGEPVLVARHEVAKPAVERMLEQYGEKELVVRNDYEWGVLSGKLSALRWVMGDEWDFLDT